MGNRSFKSIARLIRAKRQNHPQEFSQSELSHLLGYKNGQFISNVERGLCNIPLKMLGKVCEILPMSRSGKNLLFVQRPAHRRYIEVTEDFDPISHSPVWPAHSLPIF